MQTFESKCPSLEVGDDEPVLVIRSADTLGPNIVRKAAFLLRAQAAPTDVGAAALADELEEFADVMQAWQYENRATWGALEDPAAAPKSAKKATPAKAKATGKK